MIVCIGGACPARPAELILTYIACHMITASVFLDTCATNRTKGDVTLILFNPSTQLFLHSFLTRVFSMPKVSTLKTYLCFAGRANQMYIIFVFCSDLSSTARFRAPSCKFVLIYLLLLFKPLFLSI